MTQWVLVVAMHFGTGGAAIDHIPMNDKSVCEKAKIEWLKNTANNKNNESISAICLERI